MTLRIVSVWTSSFAAILLVFAAGGANAQPNCEGVPRGPEHTNCYLTLSQFYRAQSNLAADRALAQSDVAWYRAINGTDPLKPKARRRR